MRTWSEGFHLDVLDNTAGARLADRILFLRGTVFFKKAPFFCHCTDRKGF